MTDFCQKRLLNDDLKWLLEQLHWGTLSLSCPFCVDLTANQPFISVFDPMPTSWVPCQTASLMFEQSPEKIQTINPDPIPSFTGSLRDVIHLISRPTGPDHWLPARSRCYGPGSGTLPGTHRYRKS